MNLLFPIVIETKQGKLTANCDCESVIYGGAESVDEMKYQVEIANCHSKAISEIKLTDPIDLTNICWDGKFSIGESERTKPSGGPTSTTAQ